MSVNPKFVSPFHRPHFLSAAAPAGQAKLTHPGKAILAGKCVSVLVNHYKTVKVISVNAVTDSRSAVPQFLHCHPHCLQVLCSIDPYRAVVIITAQASIHTIACVCVSVCGCFTGTDAK